MILQQREGVERERHQGIARKVSAFSDVCHASSEMG